ncbi:uncharacterized protein [Argopecten irradians]|uniref:uncharacterized protein n=1 Tax=Argopecten irradians TaxID=31199 RepID=UPI0037183949
MKVQLFFGLFSSLLFSCYGHGIASDEIEHRLDALESLASTVDAIAVANGEELKTTEDNMDEKMKQYHKEIMSINRRASHHNQIGFYVRLTNSSSGADHVTKVQPVKFDFVITNQGGGYNEAHGKFTCPVNGLYQFATTIPSAARAIIDCGLVKNDHLLARLHGNTKGYDQASQVLVIECAARRRQGLG